MRKIAIISLLPLSILWAGCSTVQRSTNQSSSASSSLSIAIDTSASDKTTERVTCEEFKGNNQVFDEWSDRIKTLLPGSEGVFDIGGWCTYKDGTRIVSLITEKNPQDENNFTVPFLLTIAPDGSLKKILPGFEQSGEGIGIYIPDFIKDNMLYMHLKDSKIVIDLKSGKDTDLSYNSTIEYLVHGCDIYGFDCDLDAFTIGKYIGKITQSSEGSKIYELPMGTCIQPSYNTHEESDWNTKTAKALATNESINVTLGCIFKNAQLSIYTRSISSTSKQIGYALFTKQKLIQDYSGLLREITKENGLIPIVTPQVQSGALFIYAELHPTSPTYSRTLLFVDLQNKKIENLFSTQSYRNDTLCAPLGSYCDRKNSSN